MEQHALKNVNNHLNTNNYCFFEISGVQSYNLYLTIVHFFNTSINQTSVAAEDSCFPTLESSTPCSIDTLTNKITSLAQTLGVTKYGDIDLVTPCRCHNLIYV